MHVYILCNHARTYMAYATKPGTCTCIPTDACVHNLYLYRICTNKGLKYTTLAIQAVLVQDILWRIQQLLGTKNSITCACTGYGVYT